MATELAKRHKCQLGLYLECSFPRYLHDLLRDFLQAPFECHRHRESTLSTLSYGAPSFLYPLIFLYIFSSRYKWPPDLIHSFIHWFVHWIIFFSFLNARSISSTIGLAKKFIQLFPKKPNKIFGQSNTSSVPGSQKVLVESIN